MKSVIVLVVFLCLIFSPAAATAADFNGDGKDDIAVFREGSGLWAVRGFTRAYFGQKRDIPLPGDYYGNNRAEMTVFRPPTGLWAVRGYTRIYFGKDGDLPLGESGLKQSSNFFFDPDKHAFRAGNVTGTQWDDPNLGSFSMAIGYDTVASGSYSTAMGVDSIAGGFGSIAMGVSAQASGSHSTAMGTNIEVSGDYSFGYGTSLSTGVDVTADWAFIIHGAKVGIGSINPIYGKLQVNQDSDVDEGGIAVFNSIAQRTLRLWVDSSNVSRIDSGDGGDYDLALNGDGSGNVGVGTTSPGYKLAVHETTTSAPVFILNNSAAADADGLFIKIARANPGTSNNFVGCFEGDGSICGGLRGDGGGGVELWSYGSDFAEFLPRLDPEDEIAAADIVGVFSGKISLITRDADHVLVVSSKPIVAGNAPPEGSENIFEKVAFIGRAPVKVRGPVRAGHYIIPSGRNDGTGIAVSPQDLKADNTAQIVGRAWETSDWEGVKLVDTVVGLQFSAQALNHSARGKEEELARLQNRLSVVEEKLAKLETR